MEKPEPGKRPKKGQKVVSGGILARLGKAPNPFDQKAFSTVGRTPEFHRIAQLPRRSTWDDLSAALTKVFALQDFEDPKTWLTCPVDCVCGGLGYIKLRPRQAWALSEFFAGRGGVALLGPGEGKAQPLDAQVWTPAGPVRMGDVVQGMQVCTPDGGTARVSGVYPQGVKKVYRVTFSDGTSAESCDEHLWKVSSKQRRKNQKRDERFPQWEVKPLFEIMKNVDAGYAVPLAEPVLFAPQEPLLVDPYLLGVLLGDGSIKYGSVSVSTGARDSSHMLSMLRRACAGKGYEPRDIVEDTSAQVIHIRNKQHKRDTIQDALRALNLLGCGSEDKFVPAEYLYASVEDRLALLRGLLDTDGYVSEKSSVSFVSVSQRLAEAVVFLTQSLGGVATVTTGTKTFTYKGEKKTGKQFYRVSVRLAVCPFTIPFKTARWQKHAKYPPTRIMRKIEFVGEKETQCISVDSPDRLYLTDNFIVTHNTIITLLIALLCDWQRPMLLVPAGLRDKTIKIDMPQLAKHLRLPTNLDVRSYEELSLVKFADYLEVRKLPDAIIADEVHALKNRGAGRTKRLLRYFEKHPDTSFVAMSGSIVHRSLMDYGHLTQLALKDNAPVPFGFMELKTWADAIDEGVAEEFRPAPGALLDFSLPGDAAIEDPQQLVLKGVAVDEEHATKLIRLEKARAGFRRRFLETPAVISSPELSTTAGLIINELQMPDAPDDIVSAFKLLRATGQLPTKEFCATALEQNRHAKELILGFYYRWLWPDGKVDKEWLKARRLWKRFVRQMTTRSHGGRYYDTELQVANGVRQGLLVDEVVDPQTGTLVKDVYSKWVAIRDDRKAKWGRPEPPKETRWISEYAVDFIETWMSTSPKVDGARGAGGIVWVESVGLLEKLRERGHVCYGAGQNGIMKEKGDRMVVASFAHSVGKNLQMFSRCLFTSPMTSGKASEQALARLHRPGQSASDVYVDVMLGCRESWWSFFNARRDARYIEQTLGQQQRLNQATITVTSEEEVCRRFDAGEPLWAQSGFASMDDKAKVQDVPVHAESDEDIDRGVEV